MEMGHFWKQLSPCSTLDALAGRGRRRFRAAQWWRSPMTTAPVVPCDNNLQTNRSFYLKVVVTKMRVIMPYQWRCTILEQENPAVSFGTIGKG